MQGFARDIGCFGAGQKGYGMCNIRRVTQPAQRDLYNQRFALFIIQFTRHIGIDESRCNGIDCNVARSDFRESESMVEFIQTQMPGIAVDESEFANGDWTGKIEDLLELAPVQRNIVNGSVQIGRFIKELME